MRAMQASRANVGKGDTVRLLAEREAVAALTLLIYGAPLSGRVVLGHGTDRVAFALPADP